MEVGIERPAHDIESGAPAERPLAEQVADLVAVPLPPIAWIEA